MNVSSICLGCIRTKLFKPVSSACKRWRFITSHPTYTLRCYSPGQFPMKMKQVKAFDSDKSVKKVKDCSDSSQAVSEEPEDWNVVAYATAEGYDLSALREALKEQGLYIPSELTSNEVLKTGVGVALHTVAKYQISAENRHLYYFKEGMVVMWNVAEIEQRSIMKFLKPFEEGSYEPVNIFAEIETMSYVYNDQSKKSYINDGKMYIGTTDKTIEEVAADRFTLSNAMALSVKLGMYELILNYCIQDVDFLTDDLKVGRTLRFGRSEVLRKSGQIYALRHGINLSTDFLDTPDFYWEQEHLEALYKRAYSYFSIGRRTKVVNEKLNNCVDLMHLVSTHLSDEHHVRLEWCIIILITIEIMFEVLSKFILK